MLCGVVDTLAVVRIVFDESEEEDLEDREQRCLLMVKGVVEIGFMRVGDGPRERARTTTVEI